MIAQIRDLALSTRDKKRFKVILNNGASFHFGLKTGRTFLDHHDKTKRDNYWKRHLNSPNEKELIENLIPSPALFSAYLLWGPWHDLIKNIKYLNDLFTKHKVTVV